MKKLKKDLKKLILPYTGFYSLENFIIFFQNFIFFQLQLSWHVLGQELVGDYILHQISIYKRYIYTKRRS